MFARSYRQTDLQLPKFTVEIDQLIVLDYFKNEKDKKIASNNVLLRNFHLFTAFLVTFFWFSGLWMTQCFLIHLSLLGAKLSVLQEADFLMRHKVLSFSIRENY